LYKKARSGELSDFTGISDPYEPPRNPEIEIDTSRVPLAEACGIVMNYLLKRGLI
jgi:adenylylsulfate kinase-like enzyme